MKGLILFLTAAALACLFLPIGFLYTVLVMLWSVFKRLGKYLFVIAIALDQLGNVVMQDFFNDVIIKPNGYKFGNEDETISSVLGKNNVNNTLTKTGEILNKTLNLFEKNHSIKSIEKDETNT